MPYCIPYQILHTYPMSCFSNRSRSSDDLLDIDFSQTSFASSDSMTSGSQRNSLQLSQNGTSSISDPEPNTQISGDLRSLAGALPSSTSLGITVRKFYMLCCILKRWL